MLARVRNLKGICFLYIALLTRGLTAEEQPSALVAVSQTTLTGYVNTSALWASSAPENDSFANAATIAPGTIDLLTNLPAATLEASEPASPEQLGSVWFRWTPSATGSARISVEALEPYILPDAISTKPALSPESIFHEGGGITHGGGYVETRVVHAPFWGGYLFSVYRGTVLTNLALVTHALEPFPVEAGETLWIALEIYSPGWFSSYPIHFFLDLTPLPANDSFANGFSISESSEGKLSGHLLGATREPVEPDLPNFSGPSVWFHYTAATYGHVTIAPSDASIAIFTGDQLSNLKLIASRTNNSSLTFFGEPETVYHIAVYAAPEFVSNSPSPPPFTASTKQPLPNSSPTASSRTFTASAAPHFSSTPKPTPAGAALKSNRSKINLPISSSSQPPSTANSASSPSMPNSLHPASNSGLLSVAASSLN